MEIRKYEESLSISKDDKEKAQAAIRCRQAKASFEMKKAELESELLNIQTGVEESLGKFPINVENVLDELDNFAIAERKVKQLNDLIVKLF